MFILKRRDILIDESQVGMAGRIICRNIPGWRLFLGFNLQFGNCGWAKAPKCNFMTWRCTDKEWYLILKDFKENGIELLSETTGY